MAIIVLASNNKHKIKEFKEIFINDTILSLNDIGFSEDIEETGKTFFENALIKAKTIYSYLKNKNLNYEVIADDSGLCVNSLDGAPGVYSARYSKDHNPKANRDKLLKELKNKNDRSAYFECCLVKYFPNDTYVCATGKTFGYILNEERGDTSFGYDCIFFSTEINKCFGEATSEEKNSVSLRGKAINNLLKL